MRPNPAPVSLNFRPGVRDVSPTSRPVLHQEIWPSTPPTKATRKQRPPFQTDTAVSPKAPLMEKSGFKGPRSTAGPRMVRPIKQIGWKSTLAGRRYSKKWFCIFTMIMEAYKPPAVTPSKSSKERHGPMCRTSIKARQHSGAVQRIQPPLPRRPQPGYAWSLLTREKPDRV